MADTPADITYEMASPAQQERVFALAMETLARTVEYLAGQEVPATERAGVTIAVLTMAASAPRLPCSRFRPGAS